MEIFPYVTHLRQLMIGIASSEELKNQLDSDLNELKLHTERIKYLEEIIKLWWSPDLKTMRRGEIPEFLHYIEFKYQVERNTKDTIKDWSSLFKELKGKYIKHISLNDFNIIMTIHRLPDSVDRIIWIGTRYEGYAFGKYFGFNKLPDFIKCFVPEDGKDFRHNDNTRIKQPFEDLLKKYNKS